MQTLLSAKKFFLVLGGFIGSGGVFVCSYIYAGNDISIAILKASIGCLVGAILTQGLFNIIMKNAQEAYLSKKQKEHSEEMDAPKSDSADPNKDALPIRRR